ncbi:MAG: hypothetical protein ACE5G7_01915 [Candidatus Hydrothermarchaeaceae archaeon]
MIIGIPMIFIGDILLFMGDNEWAMSIILRLQKIIHKIWEWSGGFLFPTWNLILSAYVLKKGFKRDNGNKKIE